MKSKQYILSKIKSKKEDFLKLGIKNIGLFGSYAQGKQSDTSDIDILIDFEPDKENFDNYMAICDMIDKLFKQEKVDVVTKNGLSPYIGPHILNSVIYV